MVIRFGFLDMHSRELQVCTSQNQSKLARPLHQQNLEEGLPNKLFHNVQAILSQ